MKGIEATKTAVDETDFLILEHPRLGEAKPLTEGQKLMQFQRAMRHRTYRLQFRPDGGPIRKS
jgi:hypothetical protein